MGQKDNNIHIRLTLMPLKIKNKEGLIQWRKIYVPILEKDKCNAKIHRLQIITFYKADFNLILKLYWPKKGIQAAKQNRSLGSG